MQPYPYPVPDDEAERLTALTEYSFMGTPPEDEFDRLAALAARLFQVPIVLITMVERERQLFKAHFGVMLRETSREVSFCAHAIVQNEVFLVLDALEDPRFATNPLVLGAPFIRFYAGAPIATPTGEKIGTICLIDTVPHESFGFAERQNLLDLAELVDGLMERRRLAEAKIASADRFEHIAATSPEAIFCANDAGRLTFCNWAAERLFGYSAQELGNLRAVDLVADRCRPIYEAERLKLVFDRTVGRPERTLELPGRRKDGSEFPAEFSLSAWLEKGRPSLGAIVRDLSAYHQNEERLVQLASFDALTAVLNRGAWTAGLGDAMATDAPLTLILLDLDGFKEINDTQGHSAGDAVLREVGARLKTNADRFLMIARLGGDEFAVLMEGNDERVARVLGESLVSAISQPYVWDGKAIQVGVSVGVALAPFHGTRPEELLGAADLALYRAKAEGKGCCKLFTPAFREVALTRRAFERELRLAFENGEFELYYQPQADTRTRRLTGAEALMRGNHTTRGVLSPASFMEVLSKKPIAATVGEWTLRTACRQAAAWRAQVPDFRVGVNLMEAQFRSGRLVQSVEEILNETGLPPEGLELEIVENILLLNDGPTLALLHDLRSLGVGLAFDDYGTGFASLSLLKRFPVSRLKIDKSFIQDADVNPEDAAVVKAMVYLGRNFGMEIIAEGVETASQLEFLRKSKCPQVQGYLLGRPVQAKAFEARLLDQLGGVS